MSETQHYPLYPPTDRVIPEGEDRERLVCRQCRHIFYENPKVIVGAVCVWEDRYLLCRRAIEPRKGFWTMPAGYLELSEATDKGAIREVWEEASARIVVDGLLALYNLPIISQVHLIYRGRMVSPDHAPGIESLETGLFAWDEIPWNDLAYPNVAWSLRHHRDLVGQTAFAPRGIPEDGWDGWTGWRAE